MEFYIFRIKKFSNNYDSPNYAHASLDLNGMYIFVKTEMNNTIYFAGSSDGFIIIILKLYLLI